MVIYTAGTPVSGLGGRTYDETARGRGLRWISPDKPGYGGSNYHRQRSLMSWGDDPAALAGHLGVNQFALAGESGGGPFTLAAARRLSGRVSIVALIASAEGQQLSQSERAGQQARIRFYGWLARHAPAAWRGPAHGDEMVADHPRMAGAGPATRDGQDTGV